MLRSDWLSYYYSEPIWAQGIIANYTCVVISLSDQTLACAKYKRILTFKQGQEGLLSYI